MGRWDFKRWPAAETKGLLLTTGTFTPKPESNRVGAPPVDLTYGLAPCDLLKRYELGVRTTVGRSKISLEPDFFTQL